MQGWFNVTTIISKLRERKKKHVYPHRCNNKDYYKGIIQMLKKILNKIEIY